MRPIFTIHAGEFLVADYLERRYAKSCGLRVWVPSKDDGTDLLVTNDLCTKALRLQVKFSKDFDHDREYAASGWWTLDALKISKSSADYWVFVLPKTEGSKVYSDCFFVTIPPKDLLCRLKGAHGVRGKYSLYLTIKGGIVIDTRELRKKDRALLFGRPKGPRNYSPYILGLDQIAKQIVV